METTLDGNPDRFPLHGMPSGKVNQVIVRIHIVQSGGHETVDPHRPGAVVDKEHAPGNDILFFKDSIDQIGLESGNLVLKMNGQGLNRILVPGPQGGHPLQQVFFGFNVKVRYLPAEDAAAVLVLHFDAAGAIIAALAGGKLLGEKIQGKAAVVSGLEGIGGKSPVLKLDQVVQVRIGDQPSVIQVEKITVRGDLHSIGAVFRIQKKGFGGFIVSDGHVGSS